MESISDGELVRLARQGDELAFRTITKRHNRRLYRVAWSVLQDDAEAEDVVQETYLHALTGLAEFRGESSLSTWLTRITLNGALSRRRRQRHLVDLMSLDSAQARSDPQVLQSPFMDADNDPERVTAQREVRRLLERAINDLPEPFRIVFVMRDIEEMSSEETAAALGLREETVRTRLHRARRLLRKALDETLTVALKDAFPFEGSHCARITEATLARLSVAAPSLYGTPSSS